MRVEIGFTDVLCETDICYVVTAEDDVVIMNHRFRFAVTKKLQKLNENDMRELVQIINTAIRKAESAVKSIVESAEHVARAAGLTNVRVNIDSYTITKIIRKAVEELEDENTKITIEAAHEDNDDP